MSGAVLDVAHLETRAYGRRSALFWAFVLVTLIEGTAFALLFTSYLYLRGNFVWWPPEARMRLLPGVVQVLVLGASIVTMWKVRNWTRKEELEPTRRWLTVTAGLSVLAFGVRAWEIHALPFPWDANAYASVVWTTFGLHTLDMFAGVFENVLLTVLLFKGPLEDKHYEDMEANAYLWFALVGLWVPFALLFHLDGVIR